MKRGSVLVFTVGKRWCKCGRELITPAQLVSGRCEYCEIKA